MAAKFAKYWLPVIIYAAFIFYLSSVPGEYIPPIFAYQDVVFHILEYAFLAFLVSRALKACHTGMVYPRRFLWVICLVVIYAITDELHQSKVPGRFPSWLDITYDAVGAFVANIIYR